MKQKQKKNSTQILDRSNRLFSSSKFLTLADRPISQQLNSIIFFLFLVMEQLKVEDNSLNETLVGRKFNSPICYLYTFLSEKIEATESFVAGVVSW